MGEPVAAGYVAERAVFMAMSGALFLLYAARSRAQPDEQSRGNRDATKLARRMSLSGLVGSAAYLLLSADPRAVLGVYPLPVANAFLGLGMVCAFLQANFLILSQVHVAEVAARQAGFGVVTKVGAVGVSNAIGSNKTRVAARRRWWETAIWVSFWAQLLATLARGVALCFSRSAIWDTLWYGTVAISIIMVCTSFVVAAEIILRSLSAMRNQDGARDLVRKRLQRFRLLLSVDGAVASAYCIHIAVSQMLRPRPIDFGEPGTWRPLGALFSWCVLCAFAVFSFFARRPTSLRVVVPAGNDGAQSSARRSGRAWGSVDGSVSAPRFSTSASGDQAECAGESERQGRRASAASPRASKCAIGRRESQYLAPRVSTSAGSDPRPIIALSGSLLSARRASETERDCEAPEGSSGLTSAPC
jgi:hypothetical protein